MPAEVRIKIVDESGPAPLTGNGTGGGGGNGTSPPPPPLPPGAPDPNNPAPRRRNRNPKPGDETDAEKEMRERRERRIKRGEAWKKRKRREAWAERVNAKRKEAEDAKAESERPEKEARQRSEQRTARGKAWRRAKRLQGFRERIQERKQLRQSAITAGMTAAGLQGGGLAGAGRAAGGALGGMAGAALGPVGALVGQAVGGAVGDAVGSAVSALSRPFELVGRAAQFTARALDKVAKGDGVGALTAAADGAADVLERIPIVGGILADNLRGLSAVARSAQQVIGAFADRGKELGTYSGAISAAGARQEVAGQLRDMREASRMGDGYAKLIDKQTEFEAAMSGMLMPIKEWIVNNLPKYMDAFLDTLQSILEGLDAIHPGTTFMGEMAKEMKKAREEAKKFGTDELENIWLTFRGGYSPVAYPPAPGALGVPLALGGAP